MSGMDVRRCLKVWQYEDLSKRIQKKEKEKKKKKLINRI